MSTFDIPILVVTYKRHDTTFKVLESLKKIGAKKIYIASNHWKNDNEKEIILSLRKKIRAYINWECQLHFIIRDIHLSAKDSFSSAIDYLFENECMGIILEDDIVPNKSFFTFCKELLIKYKDTQDILMISGWSALDFAPEVKNSLQEDYFFSKYGHTWGWASWRRAWKLYQKEFIDFEREFAQLEFDSKEEKKEWHKIFKAYSQKKIDTWDYPWTYSIWKHNGLSIYPKNNMVQNIGLNRNDATNTTTESQFENMKVYDISLPLIHPQTIQRNREMDMQDFTIVFFRGNLFKRCLNKFSRILFGKIFFRL